MSQIMLNLRDAQRSLHTTIHASRVEYLVAALSADPATIEELEAALRRFLPADASREFFAGWRKGTCLDPWDSGVCLIDLTARLIAVESTYAAPGRRGAVNLVDADNQKGPAVHYHLAEDWVFIRGGEDWKARADNLRRTRLAPPLDARSVLFGKVCAFIVEAVWNAPGSAEESTGEAISAIHARWLMTPRDDLAGQAPRDVLLCQRNHISRDLQDRCDQWSTLDACPPGLDPSVTAYRYGPFGTHEIVVYYNLVRTLLHICWDRRASGKGKPDQHAEEIARLETLRDNWLETPDYEDLQGRTPASVIARERARLPEGMTGAEAMIDHDCPMCQMMAELPGPTFWHLDGSGMDDEFAFSFHRTLAEWEAEQREYEEFSRSCDERRRSEQATAADSVWKRSFVNEDSLRASPSLAIAGLSAYLAELIQDLRDAHAGQEIIDQLNRAYGNVREAVQGAALSLIEPVIERMCEYLVLVSEAQPALADKCSDLERHLSAIVRRCADGPTRDEELPF